jgi:DNA-binding IclR family transcriptional regulator
LSGKSSYPSGTPIKPVINAIRILRYLSCYQAAARASKVAHDLSINPSPCFNILRTLVGEDVLSFDAVSKTYQLRKTQSKTQSAAAASQQVSKAIYPRMESQLLD